MKDYRLNVEADDQLGGNNQQTPSKQQVNVALDLLDCKPDSLPLFPDLNDQSTDPQIEDFLARGWQLIPVEARGKLPWSYKYDCPQKNWTDIRYSKDDIRDIDRHNPDANWGILTGGTSKIVVLDFDAPEVFHAWEELHPEALNTYTVKRDNAPEGKMHLYFAIPDNMPAPASQQGEDWDFQSDGRQIVAAGSVHKTGGIYKVIKDVPLLPWRDEYLPVDEKKSVSKSVNLFEPGVRLPISVQNTITSGAEEGERNKKLFDLICQLRDAGMPIENARPKALEFASHCNPPLEEHEVDSTLASVYSQPRREPARKVDGKIDVKLPNRSGRTDGDAIEEVARGLACTGEIFLCNDRVVQVAGDHLITPTVAGLANDIENWLNLMIYNRTREKWVRTSLPEQLVRRLLESERIKRLFPEIKLKAMVLLPYCDKGNLKFTIAGYDPVHKVWTSPNAPPVRKISLWRARKTLHGLLREFCFLEPELDMARAVAYLLSPLLTLLTNECRAQIFHICANREGLGKDYLMALAAIIFTGQKMADCAPPGSDDEYRKLLLAICIAGDLFLLISNFKGHLESQALEQAATSDFIKGRILGKTELSTAANRALYAMTSNRGTISPDLERRVLDIRLEFLEEEISNRRFKRDIHDYLLRNRSLVLSALYALVQHWADTGFPIVDVAIPSFSNWSTVVASILVSCGFQNPFDKRKVVSTALDDSGNREDKDFAMLLEFCAEQGKNLVPAQLREIALQHELFSWLDLEKRSGQVAFAAILKGRDRRIYRGLRLRIHRGRTSFYAVERV